MDQVSHACLIAECKLHLNETWATSGPELVSRVRDALLACERIEPHTSLEDVLDAINPVRLGTTGVEKKGKLVQVSAVNASNRPAVGHGLYWSWHTDTRKDPSVGIDRLRKLQGLINLTAQDEMFPVATWKKILCPDKLCGRKPGVLPDHLITIAGLRANSANRAKVWQQFMSENAFLFTINPDTSRFARDRVMVPWLRGQIRSMIISGAIYGLDPLKIPLSLLHGADLSEVSDDSCLLPDQPRPPATPADSRTELPGIKLPDSAPSSAVQEPVLQQPEASWDFELRLDMGLLLLGNASLTRNLHGQTRKVGGVLKLMQTRELMSACLIALYTKLRVDASRHSELLPAGKAKLVLLQFAWRYFKSSMKDPKFNTKLVPVPRDATAADLDNFVHRHVRHPQRNHGTNMACFSVTLVFATHDKAQDLSRKAARDRYNTERTGAAKLKQCVQARLDKCAADVLENDMLSDMAMQRLRRWAMEEGENGRAVHVRCMGLRVPNFKSIKTIRATQLADFKREGIVPDALIFSNGEYVVVLENEEEAPEGFNMIGFHGDLHTWLALALRVAESRGLLARGIKLSGENGSFLGRFAETSLIAWFDGLCCGPKDMTQLVYWLTDPSSKLLNPTFTFPIPIGMWQSKEYLATSLLSQPLHTTIANVTRVTIRPYNTVLELGTRLSAVSVDHKAGAAFQGSVGSGGTCRIESAQAGLKIGMTDDEELFKLASMSDHVCEYIHVLFSTFSSISQRLKSVDTAFSGRGAMNAVIKWAALKGNTHMPRRPRSMAIALEAVRSHWPECTPQFVHECMYDGTLSVQTIKKLHALEVTTLGVNAFPGFTEHNQLVFTDLLIPECRRLLPDSSTDKEVESLLMLLLHIDHAVATTGHSLLARSNLKVTRATSIVELRATLRPREQCTDVQSILVIPGHQHNLTHLAHVLIRKIATGKNMRPSLLATYGDTAEAREETTKRVTKEVLKGMAPTHLLGSTRMGTTIELACATVTIRCGLVLQQCALLVECWPLSIDTTQGVAALSTTTRSLSCAATCALMEPNLLLRVPHRDVPTMLRSLLTRSWPQAPLQCWCQPAATRK